MIWLCKDSTKSELNTLKTPWAQFSSDWVLKSANVYKVNVLNVIHPGTHSGTHARTTGRLSLNNEINIYFVDYVIFIDYATVSNWLLLNNNLDFYCKWFLVQILRPSAITMFRKYFCNTQNLCICTMCIQNVTDHSVQ